MMTTSEVQYVEYCQHQSAAFKKLHISQTVLLRICTGAKSVRPVNGKQSEIGQGEFVYLRRGENLTIGNSIGETGLYFSEGFVLSQRVIADFLHLHPNPLNSTQNRSGIMSASFDEAFSRVIFSLRDGMLPECVLIHRVYELLLWLQYMGVSHEIHEADSLTDRLRTVLETDIERCWKAPEAAQELGMSEATLRRSLNKERTSFSKQLLEARLYFALVQLQTTDLPLAEIAYESGFSSQSRLSEAFKARFDLSPKNIRTKAAYIDRKT